MLNSYYKSKSLEAGTDEAGRGCIAGPVVAASVVLFNDINDTLLDFKVDCMDNFKNLINDSKMLTANNRFSLKSIIENCAVSYAISFQSAALIDEINILNASLTAMRESINALQVIPIYILVDGNQHLLRSITQNKDKIQTGLYNDIPYSCIIKGDSQYMTIAAASILAKTHRDLYMEKIHEEFPMYNWKKNKGYPTKEHREAIRSFGVTKYHRKSFRWLPEMTNEEFLLKNGIVG